MHIRRARLLGGRIQKMFQKQDTRTQEHQYADVQLLPGLSVLRLTSRSSARCKSDAVAAPIIPPSVQSQCPLDPTSKTSSLLYRPVVACPKQPCLLFEWIAFVMLKRSDDHSFRPDTLIYKAPVYFLLRPNNPLFFGGSSGGGGLGADGLCLDSSY